MEIIYEKANLDDIDAIVEMQAELNTMLNLHNLDEIRFREYIQADIQSKDTEYCVAKINGKTIGVVAVDFSEAISIDDCADYEASISLIYVDKKYRKGKIAYNLFKLAIEKMEDRGINSFFMSVEDNNPNKYLHFALADILIDQREENTKDGKTIQYLLGAMNINKIKSCSFKDFINKVVKTKKEFPQVLNEIQKAQTVAYLF